ncbi:MAG: DUF3100 domain-containing protein [Lachnospiraceae bacterium]|nr:DUF3100 domain-containing protein [Lachnospiraceae bacterium]
MDKKPKLWSDYRLYLTVLGITIVCEKIGVLKIPIGPGNITLLPLIYAMLIGLTLYLLKPVTFLKEQQSDNASSLISIGITLLIAKMSITSGVAINDIITAGPALILQNFGNLGTILFSLPVALLLGFRRECIGMTHSVGREPNVALISEKYGSDTPEFRGVMVVYVVGTVFGTIFMGAIASILASSTPISIEAYAMATGCGSAGMMTAALAPLIEMRPEMETTLTAFASISNLISTVGGLYISIFLGLPLTEKLYKVLEPHFIKKNNTENKSF